MHSQADRLRGEPAAGLPVIKGTRWFDTGNRPGLLRIECPLTSDEMVAALYGTVEVGDMASDEDLCGSVAVTLLIEGLPALRERAEKIRRDERRGAIESPAFLALVPPAGSRTDRAMTSPRSRQHRGQPAWSGHQRPSQSAHCGPQLASRH
jgi:hypothetical protein